MKPNLAALRRQPPSASSVLQPNSDAAEMTAALQAAASPVSAPTAMPVSLPTGQGGSGLPIPVSRIRESDFNARVFYSTAEVDEMSTSLTKNGQDVPVTGYWDGDHIVLIDGQKRLRAAKSAGLDTLRVDVVPRPENELAIYLASRRINKERSSQTSLDDCVRFRLLLDQGIFDTQDALGEAMEMSKATVSKVLSLGAISDRVMRRLKDTNIPASIKALYAISQIFSKADTPDAADALAFDVIDEAVKKDMSGNQVESLVESRLNPAVRVRNEVRHVSMGAAKGTIKLNKEKGRLDFNITGLTPEKVDKLREQVEAWCKDAQ